MNARPRTLATRAALGAVLAFSAGACDGAPARPAPNGAASTPADSGGGATATPVPTAPSLETLAGAAWAGEPNDRDHLARFVAVPSRLHARIDAPSDIDAYLLPAALLAPPATLEVHPAGDARLRLRLYDGTGELALTRTASRAGEPVGVPALAAAPEGGAWELVVDEPGATAAPEGYALALYRSALAPVASEREPNDSATHAQPLPPLPAVGFLDGPEDRDTFALARVGTGAGEGGARWLALEVRPSADVDAIVEVRCGAEAAAVPFDAAGPGGAELACGYPLGAGGDCSLTVAARAFAAGSAAAARYDLAGGTFGGVIDREPLSDPAAPDVPSVVDTGRGFLASASDVDVYTWRVITPIDADAEQSVELEPPPGVDIAFELLDEAGGLVRRQDAGGVGVTERLEVSLPSGRYRIVVRSSRGASCTAPYELRVDD
jgi:hypothetical protein